MSPAELRHRIAYGERQHDHFMARAGQAHLLAQLAIAEGRYDAAKDHLACAKRHLDFVADCNDSIDGHRRKLEPGDGDTLSESPAGGDAP